jgi:hypothetical protein
MLRESTTTSIAKPKSSRIALCRVVLVWEDKMFKIKMQTERIRKENRDPALFYYDFRHPSGDWATPRWLEKWVVVDWYGTITSTICLDKLFRQGRDYYRLKKEQINVLYEHEDTGEFFDGSLLFPALKGQK